MKIISVILCIFGIVLSGYFLEAESKADSNYESIHQMESRIHESDNPEDSIRRNPRELTPEQSDQMKAFINFNLIVIVVIILIIALSLFLIINRRRKTKAKQ